MDFLDPSAERRHQIRLFTGYALIALIIGVVSIALLYRSYGFGVNRDGDVTRSGLVFVSSQPQGADVWLDGKKMPDQTDSRLSLDSGTYALSVSRAGYIDWKRTVNVNGGDVQRFDYPLLVPKQLKTTAVGQALSAVTFSSQSPDRRWVVAGDANRLGVFIVYDLKDPKKPALSEFVLPSTAYSPSAAEHTWGLKEWSTDNIHMLIKHGYTEAGEAKHEYVLMNRESPEKSRNVTKDIALTPTDEPSLFDRKVSKYFVYAPSERALRIVSADGAERGTSASNVLAYKTFSDDTVLYVTNTYPAGKPVADKVFVVLQRGLDRQLIRSMPVSESGYLLDLAKYDGSWYVAVGGKDAEGVYVYKNPEKLLRGQEVPRPLRFLRISKPNYIAFSQNTRFILAQSGDAYALYDAEANSIYRYTRSLPMDSPQTHASWMDGHRLMYVSGGTVSLHDYDGINGRILMPANAMHAPFASPDFRYMFTFVEKDGALQMTKTPFVVEP